MRHVLSATLTATLALSVATLAGNPAGAAPVVETPVTTSPVTALSQTLDDMTIDAQPLGAAVADLTTTDAPVDARAILGEIDGTLYVTDVAEHGGSELMAIVDGAVTPMVDVNPGSSSYPVHLIELAGRHYFIGVDDGNGRRLMQLDGTEISVVPGTGTVSTQVYEADGFILLLADNGTDGFEPITFDGTTVESLGDLNPGSGFSSVYWAEPGGAGLIVYLWSNGYRLFNIGHGSVTEILHDGETIDSIGAMISDGTNAYFDLDLPATGRELYFTDGTSVTPLAEVVSGSDGIEGALTLHAVVDDVLYFSANIGTTYATFAGLTTAQVIGPFDPTVGARSSDVVRFGTKLLLTADFNPGASPSDLEPAYIETAANPPTVHKVADLTAGGSTSDLMWHGIWNNTAILSSANSSSEYFVHRYNGTTLSEINGFVPDGAALTWFGEFYLGSVIAAEITSSSTIGYAIYDGATVDHISLPDTSWGEQSATAALTITDSGIRYALTGGDSPGLLTFDEDGTERLVDLDGIRNQALFPHGDGAVYVGDVGDGLDLRYWNGTSDTLLDDAGVGRSIHVDAFAHLDDDLYLVYNKSSDEDGLYRVSGSTISRVGPASEMTSRPYAMEEFGGYLYFCADYENSNPELYRVQGSTVELVDAFDSTAAGCDAVFSTGERLLIHTYDERLLNYDGDTIRDITPADTQSVWVEDAIAGRAIVWLRTSTDTQLLIVEGDAVQAIATLPLQASINRAVLVGDGAIIRYQEFVNGAIERKMILWDGESIEQILRPQDFENDINTITQDGVRRALLETSVNAGNYLTTWHPDEGFVRHAQLDGEPVISVSGSIQDSLEWRSAGEYSDGTFEAISFAGFEPLLLGRVPSPVDYIASPVTSTGQMTVNWTAPVLEGDAPVTEYRVQLTDASGGPVNVLGSCRTAATARTCTVTGLNPFTEYDIDVSARNRYGYSVPADDVTTFVPVEPGRVVDTRFGDPKVDGVSRFKIADATVVGDPSRTGESIGVPVGASAVAINVTVTGTEDPGFVSVYPCAATSDSPPNVSNVNYGPGATVANSAVVPLSSDGYLCVKAEGATHVLIDVAGYFVSGFTTVEPGRVVDTRFGDPKVDGVSRFRIADATVVGDPSRSGESIGVPVGAGAVAINVTVTGTEDPGFVSVYPCADTNADVPNVSNVNYVANTTVANSAIVSLSSDGYLCVKAEGATHVLIDVAGYFVSGFTTVEPGRVADTRFGDPKVDGVSRFKIADATVVGDPSRSGESIGVPVGAGAVAINVTVTGTEDPGFVSVYPCTATTDTPPNVSNVNYLAGATVANSAVVPLSSDGYLCVKAEGATHVLIDVAGYL